MADRIQELNKIIARCVRYFDQHASPYWTDAAREMAREAREALRERRSLERS